MPTPHRPSQLRASIDRHYALDERGITTTQATIVIVAALLVFMPLIFLPLLFIGGPASFLSQIGSDSQCSSGGGGKQPAESDDAKGIPANYLKLYKNAGKKYDVPWNLIAGIGKEETNHGRDKATGVHSGSNKAGAKGPMQFLSATFKHYAVDGDHDGKKDIYDPADAIPATARMLEANGAPQHTFKAVFAYNHASWYVDDVLRYAKHYGENYSVAADNPENQAVCSGGNNEIPANVSGKIKKVIAFAKNQMGERYVFGATGPDTWDCSGLTMRAYQQIGITLPRTSQAQYRWGPRVPKGQERPGDLVFFSGADGSRSAPGHVGMVIGKNKMIEAPQTGDVVKISPYSNRDGGPVGFTRPVTHKKGKSST